MVSSLSSPPSLSMRPSPASSRAFTLIEVMVASTVLVVSFTAVIQSVMMGAGMLDTARKQQIAQQIIDNEINFQRRGAWGAISSMSNNTSYTLAVNSSGTAVTGDTSFFVLDANALLLEQAKNYRVSVWFDTLRSSFVICRYTVTWTSLAGRSHNRTVEAYFGRNGLHLSYQK